VLLIPFKVGAYSLSGENNFLADGNQGDCALKAGHPDAWIELVGVVTNGAIRDIPGMPDGIMMLARGEKPSHGELHMLTFGEPVQIDGLMVRDGDLVHMDRNGAAVIPHDLAAKLPEAIAKVVTRETALIKAAQQRPFDYAAVRKLMGG